jgi:hypothetical protein
MTGERYNIATHSSEEAPDVDAFMVELEALCRKHGLSIGHEDTHGAFLVYRDLDEDRLSWLKEAMIDSCTP